MKGDYLFPFQLALTKLHPDFLIFKMLTSSSPVRIDMPLWREHEELVLPKIKYTPLAKVIEENGWAANLFAIEVGAWGYSSRLLSICLKRQSKFKQKSEFTTNQKSKKM